MWKKLERCREIEIGGREIERATYRQRKVAIERRTNRNKMKEGTEVKNKIKRKGEKLVRLGKTSEQKIGGIMQ